MLAKRRRRGANIKQALRRRLVFTGICMLKSQTISTESGTKIHTQKQFLKYGTIIYSKIHGIGFF